MEITSKRKRPGEMYLRTAIAAVVASTFTSGAALAQEAEKKEDATKLDTIEVTGSRLTRANVEGALPVSTITREDIDVSGFTSVGELLRNTVFNSSGAFRAQSGSSAQSLVAVDLRGLGSERTLVLIDGRRAPKAPFAPTAQDLNAVPLAAVERIEILKDGASAIYGADAIGGVINIITRKDFQGVEISGQMQGTDRVGGDIEQSSVTIGMNSEKGNLVMGASYFKRDIIFARDSLYNSPGASFYSNNLIVLRDANRDGVFDPGDAASGDEYVYAAVPGGCPNTDPAYYLTSNGLCGYDFNLVAADEAETANQGLFAKGTYEISDTWNVTVNASINRAKSFGRYAPALNDTSLSIPSDNPFYQNEDIVQLGGDFGGTAGEVGIPDEELYATLLYHRFASIGTRDTTTDANVYDVSGIFSGSIFGFADANVGARYNEYKYYEFGRFFLARPVAQGALDDGSYDFRDPNATPDAAAAFKATTARESTWTTREVFADVQRSLFALPGGDAKLLIGWEYREEDYSDLYDAASEAGQVGGSAGNSAGLDRRVRAFFGEALFPVLDSLEFTAAIRHDNYSDFGTATSPKLSVRYQPFTPLTLRASWSEGFRAPTLDILSAKPAFSAESINNDQPSCEIGGFTWNADLNRCFNDSGEVQSTQINATSISNPDLGPEDSKQYSVGFAYDVTKWFDFSLDYYDIEIEGVIDQFTPQEILDALRVGDPVPDAFVITRGPTGRITDFIFGFANNGVLETSGLDLEANARFSLGKLGNIRSTLRYVYILDYVQDGGRDLVGDPGVPDTRAQGATEWKISDFSVGWNFNLIGDQAETVNSDGSRSGKTPTYVTHDFQLSYAAPWNGTITLGAINAFGKEPDARSAGADPNGRDFNYYLYDQYGMQPYVRYTQRF
ncbi:MAG: TonB-dependent receptor [Sinimarinibacterium sp.]|jgi:iron complex outermembrane receptor protein